MTKEERVKEALEELTSETLISVYNEYCYRNRYYEDVFERMEEFDDVHYGMKPLEALRLVHGDDFNPYDDYYVEGAYIESFSDADACRRDILHWHIKDLVKYLVANDEDFNCATIQEALNFEEEDEEDEI